MPRKTRKKQGRGGPRPGSGRPKGEPHTVLTTRVPTALAERIQRLAASKDKSVSAEVRTALGVWCDLLEDLGEPCEPGQTVTVAWLPGWRWTAERVG